MERARVSGGYDAVVLAGGAARRLDGADKPGLRVGGATLLERVLAACAGARRTVVVGPVREAAGRPVRWTREDPPGGGPVAAVAAGLPHVSAPVVLLLAADLPFLDRPTVERLAAGVLLPSPDDPAAAPDDAGPPADAAVLVDAGGRDQPLAAAYRTDALRAALDALVAGSGGRADGLPLRRLVGGLRTVRLPDTAGAAWDCDTWDQVAAARRRAG